MQLGSKTKTFHPIPTQMQTLGPSGAWGGLGRWGRNGSFRANSAPRQMRGRSQACRINPVTGWLENREGRVGGGFSPFVLSRAETKWAREPDCSHVGPAEQEIYAGTVTFNTGTSPWNELPLLLCGEAGVGLGEKPEVYFQRPVLIGRRTRFLPPWKHEDRRFNFFPEDYVVEHDKVLLRKGQRQNGWPTLCYTLFEGSQST